MIGLNRSREIQGEDRSEVMDLEDLTLTLPLEEPEEYLLDTSQSRTLCPLFKVAPPSLSVECAVPSVPKDF